MVGWRSYWRCEECKTHRTSLTLVADVIRAGRLPFTSSLEVSKVGTISRQMKLKLPLINNSRSVADYLTVWCSTYLERQVGTASRTLKIAALSPCVFQPFDLITIDQGELRC